MIIVEFVKGADYLCEKERTIYKMTSIRITVLSDNIPFENLEGEWGLSFFIEYNAGKYLLDTGASEKFISNAQKLGIDLSEVDAAVLSHAHYDHSLGMEAFFRINSKAKFNLSSNTRENCYAKKWFFRKYIGIERGILGRRADRITYISAPTEIEKGVWIVPRSTEGLGYLGKRNMLFIKENGRLVPDDFSHEQSLVFETEKGLVILNSCSHAGADVILSEVRKVFPDREIVAYLGGLHLATSSREIVEDVAKKIQSTGITDVVTGHCTGEKAFQLLKAILADNINQFHAGMVLEY